MDKDNDKPWGRFQSTYMKELCFKPKPEDYTNATRHGVRNEQAKAKTDVSTRFKFPTGVSAYSIDYNHQKSPALEDYGDNRQPCNEHKVGCAPHAGYNTTYNDGSFVLRHKDDFDGKTLKRSDPQPRAKITDDVVEEGSRPTFGPWNYTGDLKEDILVQRDRVKRAQKEIYHLPGYLGHIPMHNPPPSSTFYDKRSPEKEKMLLYDLDQYSRELWPHYKGHKPQALINVKEPPAPTNKTTYGHTNDMMQRQQAWAKANRHTNVTAPTQFKKGGTKTFFTPGISGTTSANGVLMAEKFYTFCRPLEGTLVSFSADKALASRYLE